MVHRLFVSEIYDLMDKAETPEKKQEIMVKYRDDKLFVMTLTNICHPGVEFFFDRLPEYKPLVGSVDMGIMSYDEAMRKSRLFIKTEPDAQKLTEKKREVLLIQILESLAADEAKAYGNMILKTTGINGVTKELIMQTFPHLTGE